MIIKLVKNKLILAVLMVLLTACNSLTMNKKDTPSTTEPQLQFKPSCPDSVHDVIDRDPDLDGGISGTGNLQEHCAKGYQ